MNDRVKEILGNPTCTVDQYRELVPLSRNSAYKAIERGEVEAIRVGKRIHVLTAPLRAKLRLGRESGEAA
jgi:hypothetical protein